MNQTCITIIGVGNGGQAMAGHCAALGLRVCLYNRSLEHVFPIVQSHLIILKGALEEKGYVELITDNIEEAVRFADIILIVTTATAHRDIAERMLPYLKEGQTIILNPGRTCGVLEFSSVLSKRSSLKVQIAEAQTLVYACRILSPGVVNVIGVKDKVMLAGRNRCETEYVLNQIKSVFSCFIPGKNLIHTSLENIGAIFHPSVVLFNAATIERNTPFYFYRDITPNIASFIQKLDQERLKIGEAYGVQLMSACDWITYAYPGTWGDGLCERMRNNPAYHDILGPGSIFTRQLTEDIPTGLIPMSELGHKVGVLTPLMDAVIELSSVLLDIDFRKQGRTLKNLGLSHLGKEDVLKLLS
ncbi:NAD/NADP-dependent octopine/nopaline dehydrogenase family protein [Bacteroides fluxus]|uniref:NAD/NADP-dependent octopine/nopaline dehydrogenase family protein n=1 Tax=Bacteroides fluxus TaxID=626930 RepID=UPI00267160D7|nr:NAD/NADP-dependent octopine/nopaline dehydrogenase family protein [Bacteroides fluxus]